MNQTLAYTPTWIDRLRWKLFPVETCDIPDVPAKDCLIVRTECRLTFTARLRLLVSGRILVETKTATENIIGACETASVCNVKAPTFMETNRAVTFEGKI